MDDNLYLKTERFGLGDTIVEGWHFFIKDFWKLAAVTAVCLFPVFGVALVYLLAYLPAYLSISAGNLSSSNISSTITSMATTVLLLSCGFILLSAFLGPLYIGALGRIISQRSLGQPVGVRGALRFGLSRWGAVFSASFINGIIVGLLSLLLVIPGLIYEVYYTFGIWAAALRGVGGKKALNYSKDLINGQWWRVFRVVAGLYIGVYGLSTILSFSFSALTQYPYVWLWIPIFIIYGLVTCLQSVMTVVFMLNIDPEPTPQVSQASAPAADAISPAVEPAAPPSLLANTPAAVIVSPAVEPDTQPSPLAETETQPPRRVGAPVIVGEDLALTEEPEGEIPPAAAGLPTEPAAAPRNNPAVAALVMAAIAAADAVASFLSPSPTSGISAAIIIGLLIICAVVLGIDGIQRAARMGGKGRWPSWGSLGLSLAAVALVVVAIFAPPPQVFSSSTLSLSYPRSWTKVNPSLFSICQNNTCLITLDYSDDQAQFLLIDMEYSGPESVEILDQELWSNAQQSASSQGYTMKPISSSSLQVEGHPASRRVYSVDTGQGTFYITRGLIQAKGTMFLYEVVSSGNINIHQVRSAEVDQLIQSIRFTP
jgi:hypothetical protein